jgi:glycosyltransferase involved in cell wall biosynthesis
MRELSIVVPVYNEAESLPALGEELLDSVSKLDASTDSIEILIVDDGSRDNTWQAIRALCGRDPRVVGLRLRRNFGKAAALTAGFDWAKGELVATLDGGALPIPDEASRGVRCGLRLEARAS